MTSDSLDIDDLLAHSGWVRALALRLVKDAQTADDVVQDTWMAALRHPPGRDRPLRPWLRTVVRNLVRRRHLNEERRSRREQASPRAAGESRERRTLGRGGGAAASCPGRHGLARTLSQRVAAPLAGPGTRNPRNKFHERQMREGLGRILGQDGSRGRNFIGTEPEQESGPGGVLFWMESAPVAREGSAEKVMTLVPY